MIIRQIRSLAVAAAVAGSLFAPQAAWADGGPVQNDAFSITLPAGFAAFASQSQKTTSPEGTIETTTWVSKAPTGEAVVVTVSKMPGKILDPQKLIASTRDSLIKSLKATVESETPVTTPIAGTSVLFKSDASPVFLRSQLMVEGDHLYQILYVGRSLDQRSAPTIAQMFDSFRVTPAAAQPPATPVPPPSH